MALQYTYNNQLPINPECHDLGKKQLDYAVFLPSISAIYARIISMDNYNIREKLPAGLPNGLTDLDFLNPINSLFYYPAALYSAGHAVLDPKESYNIESMVQQRDRKNTVLIGDSGGYQAATGVLKYPWHPKPGQSLEGFHGDRDKFRIEILRWLEATADYSMVLDWPASSIVRHGFDPVTGESKHPGLKTFTDCLTGSMENHEFFIKHRKEGATKFLNVLQGRNQEEGDIWWNACKSLPLESWAFSGGQASNFAINLRRLIIMRDEGYLDGREWLHYLGNGKIKAGCALTTLQRVLRNRIDSKITLSFDAASPFVTVAKGQLYHGVQLHHEKIRFKGGSLVDDKTLKGNTQLLNDWIASQSGEKTDVTSNIGGRITVGDICIKGFEDLNYKKVSWSKKEIESGLYERSPEAKVGDKFKWSRAYKEHLVHSVEHGGLFDFSDQDYSIDHNKYEVKWPSSMDGLSYVLAMNHNVEIHIAACQAACYWQDQPLNVASNYITSDLLQFKDLCDEIFTSQRPMDLISQNEMLLQNITGMDAGSNLSIDLDSLDI